MVLGFTNQPDFDMIVRPWLWIAIEELMFFGWEAGTSVTAL